MNSHCLSGDRLNLPDDDLIERIKKGENNLFHLLFDRHISKVVCYSSMLTHCREDARDVAQETFVRVFQALEGYQARGKFVSWLFTIARRIVIDQKRKRRIPVTNLESVPEILRQAKPPESSLEIELLKGIPPRDREILMLRFVMELPYQEIASITELSEGSLRNIVCLHLQRLKKEALEHGL